MWREKVVPHTREVVSDVVKMFYGELLLFEFLRVFWNTAVYLVNLNSVLLTILSWIGSCAAHIICLTWSLSSGQMRPIWYPEGTGREEEMSRYMLNCKYIVSFVVAQLTRGRSRRNGRPTTTVRFSWHILHLCYHSQTRVLRDACNTRASFRHPDPTQP